LRGDNQWTPDTGTRRRLRRHITHGRVRIRRQDVDGLRSTCRRVDRERALRPPERRLHRRRTPPERPDSSWPTATRLVEIVAGDQLIVSVVDRKVERSPSTRADVTLRRIERRRHELMRIEKRIVALDCGGRGPLHLQQVVHLDAEALYESFSGGRSASPCSQAPIESAPSCGCWLFVDAV
jgi:hypothetical protein